MKQVECPIDTRESINCTRRNVTPSTKTSATKTIDFYMVTHKNVPLYFGLITVVFIGGFLTKPFVPTELGMNTLQRSYYSYHITLTMSPHYLVKLKNKIKQHILNSVITVFRPTTRHMCRYFR